MTGPFILVILAHRTRLAVVAEFSVGLSVAVFNLTKFSLNVGTLVKHQYRGPSGK